MSTKRRLGNGTFSNLQSSSGWKAWSGYALESLAFKHLQQIKQALGIGALSTSSHSWVHRSNQTWPQGAQIDLLLDRPDNTINIIEIKFSQSSFAINKAYAKDLRNKIGTFKAITGTRKNVFLTFLTTHGLQNNQYSNELVQGALTTDSLFSH